jgi:GTP-binding protein
VRVLPKEETPAADPYEGIPRIAIVGKPNVGKSSLTNALLGEERNIVTPVAGTTRDSIETHYNKFGHEFMLVDTAGIRKKSKVHEDLEFYSVLRSMRAIERADVCILMIDATSGMEAQDMSIFNVIQKNRKGCVLVVNKWDLFIKDQNTMREYTEGLRARLAPFDDVPIVFTSVVKMQRVMDVLDAAARVADNYRRRIPTAQLNEALLPIIEETPPPSWKGKYIKVKYITQLPTKFPAFAFFCNLPQYIKDPYKRFLENQLRECFDLTGCPVQIYCRQK